MGDHLVMFSEGEGGGGGGEEGMRSRRGRKAEESDGGIIYP